ncbi:hypothetical protein KKG66_02310 [bacterium]|nr:hypothetical protein [bacterium]
MISPANLNYNRTARSDRVLCCVFLFLAGIFVCAAILTTARFNSCVAADPSDIGSFIENDTLPDLAAPVFFAIISGVGFTGYDLLSQSEQAAATSHTHGSAQDSEAIYPLLIIGAIAILLMLLVAAGMFGAFWLISRYRSDEINGGDL